MSHERGVLAFVGGMFSFIGVFNGVLFLTSDQPPIAAAISLLGFIGALVIFNILKGYK